MASADGYALPKPGVPKTLGILNVIFAVLLILFGLCSGLGILAAPAAVQFAQQAQQAKKAGLEAQRAKQLKTLDDRARSATTDEEKATIAKERQAVATIRPASEPPDMTASLDSLKDPRVMGFAIAQLGSGLLLHILLLVAGIGLIRLTPWGRTLGIWWAGLQIAQIVILSAISFSMIMPIQRESTAKQLVEMKKKAEAPNATPDVVMTYQFTEMSARLTPAFAAVYLVAALTYPIVCLVLLRTPGARAACVGATAVPPPGPGPY